MVTITDTSKDEAPTENRAQRRAKKGKTTYADLSKKKLARHQFTIKVNDEELDIVFQAISRKEYDKLIASCPPTKEQLAEDRVWNPETFGPKLIAAVSVEPELTEEEAEELWTSPEWSSGDIGTLFSNAINLCNRGMDVGFTGRG